MGNPLVNDTETFVNVAMFKPAGLDQHLNMISKVDLIVLGSINVPLALLAAFALAFNNNANLRMIKTRCKLNLRLEIQFEGMMGADEGRTRASMKKKWMAVNIRFL
jgi:hypothetical protein